MKNSGIWYRAEGGHTFAMRIFIRGFHPFLTFGLVIAWLRARKNRCF